MNSINSDVRLEKLICITCLIFSVSGCVTYREFPVEQIDYTPAKQYDYAAYRIKGGSIAGGSKTLLATIKDTSPFKTTERLNDITDEGVFIDITIKSVAPSFAAIAWGYVSASTLTLTPAWSTQDGNDVIFTVYKDGERVKTFEYKVRRKAAAWIVMLPIIWVNLFTYSEEDAFKAISNQFFDDAEKIIL